MTTCVSIEDAQNLDIRYDATMITKTVPKYKQAHQLPAEFGKEENEVYFKATC
jgi:hypothetical protein